MPVPEQFGDERRLDLTSLKRGDVLIIEGKDGEFDFRATEQQPGGPVGLLWDDKKGVYKTVQLLGSVPMLRYSTSICNTLLPGIAIPEEDAQLAFLVTTRHGVAKLQLIPCNRFEIQRIEGIEPPAD